jgi:hypothetical protein
MGKFLISEKTRQSAFKANSSYFSNEARSAGYYKGTFYPFCLPVDHAEENLFPPIRQSAKDFFTHHAIKWHDGQNGKPSNHLCSSMVCCVNFLFPFADKPGVLADLLRPYFPIREMMPIEDGKFVSFKWIGQQNYLGEKRRGSSERTRGANFTSADAAVMIKRTDGRKQIVLIEWKYTESYGGSSIKIAKSGTDRSAIYRHLFDRADCPINKDLLPNYDDLFYEPFYQFMRQQFLAHEMEKAHELGADVVSLLHICPSHNEDFRKVTSPTLVNLGDTATGVWKKLVMPQKRFLSVSVEELFGRLSGNLHQEIKDWEEYIHARYDWLKHH